MDSRPDSDNDDDFSEIYKEYTGPLGSTAPKMQEKTSLNKRPQSGSDEEDEAPDPNAVPTDFTSREAKVWEAKSKATERNWKKRKEEEFICKLCGESGHFTQGCPSTLGANRKSQDFFERVPARENHVKALFTEKVVTQIEKDIGCKIKIEEKFIIVSGKDRLILKKGVDAVHKVKEEGGKKSFSSSNVSRSRTPPERRSSVSSRLVHSDLQRSNHSPHRASQFDVRHARQEKLIGDRFHDDLQNVSRGSPQAYGNDGVRRRSSQSSSPGRRSSLANSYNSRDSRSQSREAFRATDGWDGEPRVSDMNSGRGVHYPAFLQTLEEIELAYKREADELGRIRDKEEDEENHKHREAVREIRENYLKNLAIIRGSYVKQKEELIQVDAQRMMKQASQQNMHTSGFGHPYNQTGYPEYSSSAGNAHYSVSNLPADSRTRYPNPMDGYPPSRPHDSYDDFCQRRNEYGKPFDRF